MANLKDTLVLGKLTVTDSIIADKFIGPLEGTANKAIADESGNNIKNTYAVGLTGSFENNNRYIQLLNNNNNSAIGSQISLPFVKKSGDVMTGPLNIHGTASSQPLIVRGIVGSDGNGTVDNLYLQYGANKPICFGNTGAYTISEDGSQYSGNAATATKWANERTLTIGATGKSINGTTDVTWTPFEMRVTRAQYNVGSNMNQIADHGCELGMANLSGTDTTINPNGGTSWHHYINMTWSDTSDNNGTTNNEWCTQIANKAGTTDLWIRSRNGGSITDGSAWAAPWTRILTGSNWTSVVDGRYLKLSGGTMSGTLNMNNNKISGIGDLAFADPGANEGITWTGGSGWWIYESPDDLSNAAGNLQFVHGSTRRLTINTSGQIDVNGTLKLANNTWNLAGDDAMFGDQNVAGAFCIKGSNGTTTLRMYSYDTNVTTTANFQYNTSDKCIDVIFN